MNRHRIYSIISLFCIFFIVPTNISADTFDALPQDRLIVKFNEYSPDNYKDRIMKRYQEILSRHLERLNTYILTVEESKRDYYVSMFSRIPGIEYVEPDYVANASYIPNDPYFPDQWGIMSIQTPDAWDITQGSDSVDVAILDTGIESHQDLTDTVILSNNFTFDVIEDNNGHGTHVAGIIAAAINNKEGVTGVSPYVDILNAKVLTNSGSGYYSWIAEGIYWAVENGADIINLSLSGRYSSNMLFEAIQYAYSHGCIIVAAAGNEGRNRVLYPAYYNEVIAVGAIDEEGNRASFSNYGLDVDLVAPGVSILSTRLGSYSYMSGTSMATPFVSATAALIKSKYPDWTNEQIRQKLFTTATDISGTGLYWNYGKVNACEAVDCGNTAPAPQDPSPLTPTPTLTPTPMPIDTPQDTPTPTPSMTPTSTPTPTVTPTPILHIEPTTTPSKPWWCRYIPYHRYCL